MSLDHAASSMMKAFLNGAFDYWLKPFDENQIQIMWKHNAEKFAFRKNIQLKKDDQSACFVRDATVMQNKISSNSKEIEHVHESENCHATPRKKPRLVWSEELHHKFLNALIQIGLESMIN